MFIAYEISSRFELPGDSGPIAGQYKTIVKPTSLKGEPLRALPEQTEAGALGIKMAQWVSELRLNGRTILMNYFPRQIQSKSSAKNRLTVSYG